MIALYILIGICLLFVAVIFLPISVSLKFKKELTFKVDVAGFKIYPKQKNLKSESKTTESPIKQKGIFEVLKEKRGFVGAVKEIFSFMKNCIEPSKRFLRFVNFKKVRLYISVVGEDAAKTAVDYGLACSAVYPTLSCLEELANVSYKKIDVKADFEGKESELEFSLKIKSFAIFIIIFAVKIFDEYKKFSVRNGLQ